MPVDKTFKEQLERLVDEYGKAEADSAAWSCSDGSPYIFVSEAANVARAARRALIDFATKGEEWLPIETAPKDKTEVLVWGPNQDSAYLGIYDDQWWVPDTYCSGWTELLDEPTHWRPLPAPPTPTPLAEGEKNEDN